MLQVGTVVKRPVNEVLREFRKFKGLTQLEMAGLLGINRTTYANYEAGVSNMPKPLLAALEQIGFSPTGSFAKPKIQFSTEQTLLMLDILYERNTSEDLRARAYNGLLLALGLDQSYQKKSGS